MPSIRHFGFGLGIVLSSLGWLSAGAAQEQSAPCQAIRNACRDAGFVVGGPAGGRLMIDCFEPIVHGEPRSAGAARPLPNIPAPLPNNCQVPLRPALDARYQPPPRVQIP